MREWPTDKKSLFGRHRPAYAEIMPEPVRSSDLMVWSMPEVGVAVKILANQRL